MGEGSAEREWVVGFLRQLATSGWSDVFGQHGWDLDLSTALQLLPGINRKAKGFGDFAEEGVQAIAPGQPPLSLLYHALMSPAVHPSGPEPFYPELKDIDRLENYICSLSPIPRQAAEQLQAVVLAYEYRPRKETPHEKHADWVFSRCGVGRVGTVEHYYSPKRRCFVAESDQAAGIRVRAVRYGVFLCRPQTGVSQISLMGKEHAKDDLRTFWEPVHKLFSGRDCVVGAKLRVSFRERHVNDKLRRMVEIGGLKLGTNLDLHRPPFHIQSDRDVEFVSMEVLHGSAVIARKPCPLVRVARQGTEIATFEVPRARRRWFGFSSNRRYTSMRVGQSLLWMAVDYLVNGIVERLGKPRAFLSPRNCAEFTNIRHTLDEQQRLVDLNLLPKDEFTRRVGLGSYQAVLFEDGVADGLVHATVEGLNGKPVKPAYSLMTAPDFLPRVAGIDLADYADNFVIGGIEPLCAGRLYPNPFLHCPEDRKPAFAEADDTIMAVFSVSRVQARVTSGAASRSATRGLPDVASNIFAPGWDVTYGRRNLWSAPFYHTAGLGSPFMEDVKLCAAANGMWPAASPDAARTYRRSTRTALPLTDEELGLSPQSALVAYLGHTSTVGWDGEYGPYVCQQDGNWGVNYASITRADYVSNALEQHVNFKGLRPLTSREVRARMSALKRTHCHLRGDTKLSESPYWLVSFTKIEHWASLSDQLNLPPGLEGREQLVDGLKHGSESGYLLIYASDASALVQPTHALKRVFVGVPELHVAQVCGNSPPRYQKLRMNARTSSAGGNLNLVAAE